MLPIRDSIPSRNPPLALYAIIALNVVVFLFELTLPHRQLDQLFLLFGVVPARYTHPSWANAVGFPGLDLWPFLTSMFLHGGWMHILGNMWTLWIFGDNIEDRMGPVRFVLFYVLCGIVAAIVHLVTNPSSQLPTVGASGAIAGVLGAYFLLFPHAKVVVVLPIIIYPLFFSVPAIVYLGFWFLSQIFSGFGSLAGPSEVGGVAWWAHIGGFLTGMLLVRAFLPAEPKRHPWQLDEYGPEAAWRKPERLRW